MIDPYDHYAVGGGGVCCICSSFFHLSHNEFFTKTYVECGYILNVILHVTKDFVGFFVDLSSKDLSSEAPLM